MNTPSVILFVTSGLFLLVGIKTFIFDPLPKDIVEPSEVFGYRVGIFLPFVVVFITGLYLHYKAVKKAKMLKNEEDDEGEEESEVNNKNNQL